MKKYHIIFLGVMLAWMNSCREEPIELCPEIYIPMSTSLTYIDSQGNNLFVGEDKKFEVKNLAVHKLSNDSMQPINFTIASDSSYITIHLEQSVQDTFFIELKPGTLQQINYKAELDESQLPCENYKVTALESQGNPATFYPQEQLWKLKFN